MDSVPGRPDELKKSVPIFLKVFPCLAWIRIFFRGFEYSFSDNLYIHYIFDYILFIENTRFFVMLRTLIVDDEHLNMVLLESLSAKYCPEVEIIAKADNVDDAIDICLNQKPDLMFLDIQIHNQTAFDILEAIAEIPVMVVMVTAYENYALKAIKNSVIDYLLKPVRISEFRDAVVKAVKLKSERTAENQVNEQSTDFYLALPSANKLVIAVANQIVRLEGMSNYTKIYTEGGQCHTVTKTLKEYELKLPPEMFVRVHKSHIINIQQVEKILRSKNGSLLMKDGSEIPIAAGRKKMIQDKILF